MVENLPASDKTLKQPKMCIKQFDLLCNLHGPILVRGTEASVQLFVICHYWHGHFNVKSQ